MPQVDQLACLAGGDQSQVKLPFETAPLPGTTAERFVPSAERISAEIDQVMARQLSPALSDWVARYAKTGRRNPFLWNWCRQAVEITTLPCVGAEWFQEICDTKTLGVMWDVMLDDLADQNGNPDLLEALLALPQTGCMPDLGGLSLELRPYAQLTCDIWREIMDRVREYPLFGEYKELLQFDYLQLCNVMRYSHLLNARPELLNMAEHDQFTAYNMHIMVCSTIDLMASTSFDRWELGNLRELIWHTQWMGRIGNLVTTWEREVYETDFSSGVFAHAVSRGELSPARLVAMPKEEILHTIRSGGHEEYFLERWQQHRQFVSSRMQCLRSFDVRELLAGYEKLFCLHLGSRGRK